MVARKSAHAFSDWAWQRATAMTMLIYTILLGLRFAIDAPAAGYLAWKLWFSPWSFRALTLLFAFSLIYHAWLGVKEILMDYVHNIHIRAKLQAIFGAALVGDAGWVTYTLWSLS